MPSLIRPSFTPTSIGEGAACFSAARRLDRRGRPNVRF
jgi:hypothetical protein